MLTLLVFIPFFSSVYTLFCAATGQTTATARLTVVPVYWTVWVSFAYILLCEVLTDTAYQYEVIYVYRFFT